MRIETWDLGSDIPETFKMVATEPETKESQGSPSERWGLCEGFGIFHPIAYSGF